jgi:predicted glycoside hydrolase/deacetylase ChbG (UPF0249 family)
MSRHIFFLTLSAAFASNAAFASEPSLPERLGHEAGSTLLIVHADDLGASHSTNRAFIEAWQKGIVNSGSIMVPTPWFPEIADFARRHPEADLGLHLTLTAEWEHLKWGPVLPASEVPSLVDEQGFLPPDTPEAVAAARPEEVRAELRAQVERAKAFGIEPTHLDSHMGVLFANSELLQVLLDVGAEYGLPVMVPSRLLDQPWLDEVELGPNEIWLQSVSMASPEVPADGWQAFYDGVIEGLEPGVHEIIIHLAFDDDEMRAVTIDHPDYGSAWRQRDFDVFTSPGTKSLLDERGVRGATWAQIHELMLDP